MAISIFNTANISSGTTNRIITFLKNTTNYFVAIGKPTSWSSKDGIGISDINPPIPRQEITNIPEIIVYKRVTKIIPALLNKACYDVDFDANLNTDKVITQENLGNNSYSLIPVEKLYESDGYTLRVFPTHLYISTKVDNTDYTENSFRAIGFYTNLTFNSGVANNKLIYKPSEVKHGYLNWASYSTPVERLDRKVHNIEFLITF